MRDPDIAVTVAAPTRDGRGCNAASDAALRRAYELLSTPGMVPRAALVVGFLACGSCSGSSLGESTGTGGAAGTIAAGTAGVAGTSEGGTTGVGGTSGGGTTGAGGTDGTPIEASVPRCLAELVASCTCQWNGGACGAQACFAAGVTATTLNPERACDNTSVWAETRVFKADGSLCYVFRRSGRSDHACEDGVISWWDASGQMVASADGFYHSGSCGAVTPTITCAATGETGVVPDPWPNHDCPANACQ